MYASRLSSRMGLGRDLVKIKYLEYLKQQQILGPFTAATEIKAFLETDTAEKLKQDRLYIEIRYAKTTCLYEHSDSQSIFFGWEKMGKRWHTRYTLIVFWNISSKAVAKLSITDLRDTLGNIHKKVFANEEHNEDQSVIVFWVEAGKRQWYLGLVDQIHEDGSIFVNHFFLATRSNKLTWTFPKEPDVQIV